MFPFPLSFFYNRLFPLYKSIYRAFLKQFIVVPSFKIEEFDYNCRFKTFTASMSSSIGMCGIMVVWFSNVNLTTLKNLECLFFVFPWEVKGVGGGGRGTAKDTVDYA